MKAIKIFKEAVNRIRFFLCEQDDLRVLNFVYGKNNKLVALWSRFGQSTFFCYRLVSVTAMDSMPYLPAIIAIIL